MPSGLGVEVGGLADLVEQLGGAGANPIDVLTGDYPAELTMPPQP